MLGIANRKKFPFHIEWSSYDREGFFFGRHFEFKSIKEDKDI